MDKPNIQFVPDVIFQIGSLDFNAGHMAMLLISLSLFVILLIIANSASLKPSRSQLVLEGIMSFFLEKAYAAFTDKKMARFIFSFIITMFLVIIVSNLFSVIPVVESLLYGDKILLRAPTSDVAMPLSLGLFIVVFGHLIAFVKSPLKHIGNYIKIAPLFKARSVGDVLQAFLDMFLGVMDIIGELSKIVSISFRLFGNIFAGFAIAAVFSFLAPYFLPIPFNILGIFSGVIQAGVFGLLALQFVSSPIEGVES